MPKPHKHVFVCTEQRPTGHLRSSCAQHGCGEVYDEFRWELQNRNLSNSVYVMATGCMGPCSEGPSVLVYPEGVMYAKVTKGNIAEIFEQQLMDGSPIEDLKMSREFW